MKFILTIFLSCTLIFGQVVYAAIQDTSRTTGKKVPIVLHDTIKDTTISEEEQFLQEISDEAYAKDERRKELTNDLLIVAVIYLLIDKLITNK